MVVSFSRLWINPVRLPIQLVVSCTGKMSIPLSPFAPENVASETGSAVPSRVGQLTLQTQVESGALLTEFLPLSAIASIYLSL